MSGGQAGGGGHEERYAVSRRLLRLRRCGRAVVGYPAQDRGGDFVAKRQAVATCRVLACEAPPAPTVVGFVVVLLGGALVSAEVGLAHEEF